MYDIAHCLAVIGACCLTIVALKYVYLLSRAIKSFLVNPCLGIDVTRFGAWAVVTGATDGIGKEYAKELAKRGLNIVLVSRSQSKLDQTASEINKLTGCETKCIAVDFTNGLNIYECVESQLKGIDVGILVNNVGMSHEFSDYYHLITDSEKKKVIDVNILSLTFMTSMLIPRMVERRRGLIVNIGSSACYGFPSQTVYSATKAYCASFSDNLQQEYRHKGIVVQCVNPFFVATNMTGIRKSSFFVPSAQDYVKSALHTIGTEATTYGYFSHWIFGVFLHVILPSWYYKISLKQLMEKAVALGKKKKEKREKHE